MTQGEIQIGITSDQIYRHFASSKRISWSRNMTRITSVRLDVREASRRIWKPSVNWELPVYVTFVVKNAATFVS